MIHFQPVKHPGTYDRVLLHAFKAWNLLQYFCSRHRMGFYYIVFFGGELAVFIQNGSGNAYLSYIVHGGSI